MPSDEDRVRPFVVPKAGGRDSFAVDMLESDVFRVQKMHVEYVVLYNGRLSSGWKALCFRMLTFRYKDHLSASYAWCKVLLRSRPDEA